MDNDLLNLNIVMRLKLPICIEVEEEELPMFQIMGDLRLQEGLVNSREYLCREWTGRARNETIRRPSMPLFC